MSKKVELNEMELEKASGGNIIKDITNFVEDVVYEVSENILGLDTKEFAKVYDKTNYGGDDKDDSSKPAPSISHQNNSIADRGL